MTPISDSLFSAERRDHIVRFVTAHGRASVDELADALHISAATVRRDIILLAQEGRVQRVRGGVRMLLTASGAGAQPELPALQREQEQSAEKVRIGAAAAALIRPGETIFIGSGTTALAAARALRAHAHLTVITNSLLIVNALADAAHIELITLGGQLRRSEMSLIGHTAERALADLRADRVLMGIRAIDAHAGLTNDSLPETQTDRAILSIAREVILLADHTKFGRTAPAFVAPLSAVHTIITDQRTPQHQLAAAGATGVRVITV
jgi:DeoR/GlpR family transcriptional regulator of sugar metabolism